MPLNPCRLLALGPCSTDPIEALATAGGLPTLSEPVDRAGAIAALAGPGGPLLLRLADPADLALLDGAPHPMVGFGEALRRLAFDAIGPDGLFAQGRAARVGADPVVLICATDAAIASAWGRLLGPFLAAPAIARPDAIAPPAAPIVAPTAAAPASSRVAIQEIAGAPRPQPASAETPPGWRKGLEAIGGTLRKGAWVELPEALERLAPVHNVLDSAGEHGEVRTPDGTVYAAFGFPDLERPQSKVLLVAAGEPYAEIVALHRHPRQIGLVREGEGGLLPSADRDPGPLAEALVGRAPPNWGTLFAVEADAVYISREQRVWRWDGRKETELGRPSQALASLLLQWSQR